ncbi:MAG: hypothetical protein ABSE28_24750 [Candidatus Sulfotelmatobacter sp.]|jgi:hypothetical protein
MLAYHIVKIGELPGNQPSDSEGATCYAWSLMRNKDQLEVVAADFLTGEVKRRYASVESERVADVFRNPKIN